MTKQLCRCRSSCRPSWSSSSRRSARTQSFSSHEIRLRRLQLREEERDWVRVPVECRPWIPEPFPKGLRRWRQNFRIRNLRRCRRRRRPTKRRWRSETLRSKISHLRTHRHRALRRYLTIPERLPFDHFRFPVIRILSGSAVFVTFQPEEKNLMKTWFLPVRQNLMGFLLYLLILKDLVSWGLFYKIHISCTI